MECGEREKEIEGSGDRQSEDWNKEIRMNDRKNKDGRRSRTKAQKDKRKTKMKMSPMPLKGIPHSVCAGGLPLVIAS